jgi:hypothetical protein
MPDASEIVSLIRDNPLCASCIADETGSTEAAIVAVLHRIGMEVIVVDSQRSCWQCGRVRHTYMVRTQD